MCCDGNPEVKTAKQGIGLRLAVFGPVGFYRLGLVVFADKSKSLQTGYIFHQFSFSIALRGAETSFNPLITCNIFCLKTVTCFFLIMF